MVQKTIEIKNLTLAYNKNWKLYVKKATIEENSIVAFSGANGSGKSTLLRSIALLFKPESGQITIFGNTAYQNRKSDLLIRKTYVTMVHQNPYLFKGTAKYNIMLGLKAYGNKNYHEAKNLLKLFEKEDIENEKVDKLSGGQRQKVALVRAMAMPVKILIFDEPLEGLDKESKPIFLNLCKKMSLDKTILISSHKAEDLVKISDKIYNLSNGSVFSGNPKNIFRGKLIEENGSIYFDTGKVRFAAKNEPEATTALINPDAISLSFAKQDSSIRNCLKGKVKKIIQEEDSVSVTVEAGELFSATITNYSAQRLMLKPDDDIYVAFKANSVKLF